MRKVFAAVVLSTMCFPAFANFDYKLCITLDEGARNHYFEAFLESNEWGAAVSGECKYLGRITPKSDGQVIIESNLTCQNNGQSVTTELPVYTLDKRGGEANMAFQGAQGESWRYAVALTSPK
ncbi:hypothetical protein VIBNISO65_460010 [Vibrio nigripulchritudo SO65]|uniref:hypothetical protein n=1 Tax=Vibrio nigripulchritudo TaxID=28173 RepID=UPI0003B1DDBB|nr:hypothetical protein [Vibrio nigripulchritudo]CCN36330.1 hypothetical protein VIBNIAM115_290036 [Vibrio nigripulchritudo AM115]CCN39364.1 hypothetical protein VIBNIFTn2_1040010 [Vibrio nigripulchritudo FTn2]CCN63560.1 hypothetical protein VIBNIPon4_130157 [Vibrio nigripulchritudo POn4]CCN78044.1 hypothetical protein VIBNISO65_460010 [Vibrio nigripulchritudo SO65]